MEQNRSDNTSNQQQNVHLHMHHVCNCQGSIYPAYYPAAVGYRATPMPPLVPYPAHPAVARPYLQHYQYTQFNVGSQYAVPISHVAATSSSVYGTTAASGSGTIDLMYSSSNTTALKEKREREEGSGDVDRTNEPPEGYDFGHITPPANELLVTENSETATPENFVKFLERSCLTAEQIAYRNRNRPCFRNIQNLCIRTRSEILKPCTTISNIHSQGIPWATKDFIYAFVRLTNCWHILKGYWENRDGSSLGKIEKELTPEFRACYVRWEKETIELAAQLTRVFYNLDTNLNTSSGSNVYAANNLIPPQVSPTKSSSPESIKKTATHDTIASTTMTNNPIAPGATSKNVRGILHLPGGPVMETTDQANQTCAGDFCNLKDEEYDSEEERRIYMKPGSYNVPKKGIGSSEHGGNSNSPRAIEFLETAQNVNKARDVGHDRYWAKKPTEIKVLPEEEKSSDVMDVELNLSSYLNVNEWLISSNFTDFDDPSRLPPHQHDLRPFYVDSSIAFDSTPQMDTNTVQKPVNCVTVLQRGKNANGQKNNKNSANRRIELSSNNCRKKGTDIPCKVSLNSAASALRSVVPVNHHPLNNNLERDGGLTENGNSILEAIVLDMKMNVLNGTTIENDKINFDKIYHKLRTACYKHINEVIRDLKYVIKQVEKIEKTEWFSQNLEFHLAENFAGYEFAEIKGDLNEAVGPLKLKTGSMFISDGEQFT